MFHPCTAEWPSRPMAQARTGLTLGGRGAVVLSRHFRSVLTFHAAERKYPIKPKTNRTLNTESRHMESLHALNEELSLSPQRNTPPATKTIAADPPQPAGPIPVRWIGCPGCDYGIRVPGVWSPYRHERSGAWIKVWYFGATCPNCKTPEGVAEYPFSVMRP